MFDGSVAEQSRFTLEPQERQMHRTFAVVSIVIALTGATSALARPHHQQRSDPAPYSHVESGWGPPTNWNDIEISHPEGGG
jgi:hypothetical protein